MTSYCRCGVKLPQPQQSQGHGTLHSSDIHRPFSPWRFWVYYEVKRKVINFWIC